MALVPIATSNVAKIAPSMNNSSEPSSSSATRFVPAPEIFKAYDVRGIVGKTLTAQAVEAIGHATGSEALARKQTTVAIGYDGRASGPELAAALAHGLQASGINVIDVGMVATPMLYFTAYQLNTLSGVMVTGSHNPPEYNGLKMMLGGDTLAGDAIQALRVRIERNDLAHGSGGYRTHDIREEYLQRVTGDVKLARPLRIAVDCGNGVAGATAPDLYRRLGCEVYELFCDVDSRFPNHHPDPSRPENLQDLIAALKADKAEIGLAFDGDGDRLGVVTKNGNIIYPDRQLMLFAADVLSRNPGGKIIFDVKSTRNLFAWIRKHGGRPLLWKTGHSFVKAKLKETGALLAGEMSGHIFFKERWYGFDDALYAGARLLEILAKTADITAALESLPDAVSTPELHVHTAEGENYTLMDALKRSAKFEGCQEIITIDGMRVEYADGFGLARPSNTTPVIVLRFEAENEAALKRIQDDFRRALTAVKPDIVLPY
jgi:phosphomannomutase/phosphoglucomutase